jgi:hypothetical protein
MMVCCYFRFFNSLELKDQITAYSCALVRMCSHINEQKSENPEQTRMDSWFEEWSVLRGVLIDDISSLRRFAPEVYAACYLCIALKLCFGLSENETKTDPIWTNMVDYMLEHWNSEHRNHLDNKNYTAASDPPHSLSHVTVPEFIKLIEGNDSVLGNDYDEEHHPYAYDLKSKKHNRYHGLYRLMRNALLGDSVENVQVEQQMDLKTSVKMPLIDEESIKKQAKHYVKYKEFAGWTHWKRGKRLEGRVNDGTPREHLQFSFLLESMCEFLNVEYADMLRCMSQCERSLFG